MRMEKPCSPGHCLGILNAQMRTDILRKVHQGIEARTDQRGKKSPLEILMESIEDVLKTCEDVSLLAFLGRNPFHHDPSYRFHPESDYHHDMRLLKHQLRALQEIWASLDHQ